MIVVVPTVVNSVPGWVVAYFQGVSHRRMYSYGWFMEIVKSVWKWAECREDAERLAESMSDPYLSRPQTGKFREPKDVLHKSWLLSELFRRSLGYVDGAAGHKNLKHMADKIEYHAP
eukprot:gene18176-13288_t